jgi:hypothetical protein
MIQPLRHMPILSTSLLTCKVKMIQPLRHMPILSTSLLTCEVFTIHVNNEVDNIGMCRKG